MMRGWWSTCQPCPGQDSLLFWSSRCFELLNHLPPKIRSVRLSDFFYLYELHRLEQRDQPVFPSKGFFLAILFCRALEWMPGCSNTHCVRNAVAQGVSRSGGTHGICDRRRLVDRQPQGQSQMMFAPNPHVFGFRIIKTSEHVVSHKYHW